LSNSQTSVNGPMTGQYVECSMRDGKYVKSFDGKQYAIPLVQVCYTVLAKDSTSHHHPSFHLMAKRQPENNNAIRLKLMAHENQYEMELKGEGGKMEVAVNGEVVEKSNYRENGISTINSPHSTIYIVRCGVTGVEVLFDGHNIFVRLAPSFTNKQSGVCGHYNLDSDDDLVMADGEQSDNLREFHASFLQNEDGGKCDDAIRSHVKGEAEETMGKNKADYIFLNRIPALKKKDT